MRVEIKARTSGSLAAALDIVLGGTPDGSGGVVLQTSQATFGSPSAPSQYQGQIVQLNGHRIVLGLTSATTGRIDLVVDVAISGSQVTGSLASASPSGDDGGIGAGR